MDCDKIREKLPDHIEGTLLPAEESSIRGHLASCADCREAYADLEKTVEIIRDLENVEPPPWLTQKVMARVREEAAPKKSLWWKLFRPLSVKLPLEAAATVLIAVAALYIYRATQPEMRTIPMAPVQSIPAQRKAFQPYDVPDRIPPGTVPSGKTAGKEALPSSQAEGRKTEGSARQSKEEHLQAIPPKDTAAPGNALPAPTLQESGRDMPAQGMEVHAGPARELQQENKGRIFAPAVGEETKQAEPSVPPKRVGKATGAVSSTSYDLILTLNVRDPGKAHYEISKVVSKIGGRITPVESSIDRETVMIEIESRKVGEMRAALKRIGEVEEKGPVSGLMRDRVIIKVDIVKMPAR